MRIHPAPAVVGLVALLASAACIDLDVQYEIKDLRILAMRLDPPEIVYSPFLAFPVDQRPPLPSPPVEVRATVLAVDPRAEEPVTFTTHFCPESGNAACRNYEIPPFTEAEEYAPEQLRAELEAFTAAQAATIAPDADGVLHGSLGSWPVTERVTNYVLGHGPNGAASIGLEDYARVIVEAEHQGIREVAFRRLPFNVNFDFSMLPPALAEQLAAGFAEILGVAICDAEQSQQEAPDCLKQRPPNRNPTLEEVRFSRELTARPEYDDEGYDTREVGEPVDGPIRLAPGEQIRLWPVFARGDLEPYQVWEVDLQAQRLELANKREEIATSWYSDSSNFPGPPLTPPVVSDDLWAQFTYPEVSPPEQVNIYMVIRDQRGGMDWKVVEVVRD